MKVFVLTLCVASALASPQSYSSFTAHGANYGYHHSGEPYVHKPYSPAARAPTTTPEPATTEKAPVYAPKTYAPVYAPKAYVPEPYAPKPYTPDHYAPHYPAPHHPAPSYGHHAPHGYEQPKHNCTIQDVIENVEVCTPAFETVCEDEEVPILVIVEEDYCYNVTRTICTETIEEIPNEICSYNYQQKKEDTTARSVDVSFKKETNVQMVTVCQPGYGHGYHQYGHQYCKEVAQETAYNVPVATRADIPVEVAYPEPVKTCVNKPISLPRVSCSDLKEEKCIKVPEVEDSTEYVEKCVTKVGEPSCQKIDLTLPKQVCIELVYGYAHNYEASHDQV